MKRTNAGPVSSLTDSRSFLARMANNPMRTLKTFLQSSNTPSNLSMPGEWWRWFVNWSHKLHSAPGCDFEPARSSPKPQCGRPLHCSSDRATSDCCVCSFDRVRVRKGFVGHFKDQERFNVPLRIAQHFWHFLLTIAQKLKSWALTGNVGVLGSGHINGHKWTPLLWPTKNLALSSKCVQHRGIFLEIFEVSTQWSGFHVSNVLNQ